MDDTATSSSTLSPSFLHGFFKRAYAAGLNADDTAALMCRYIAKRAAENPNIRRGFERRMTKLAEQPGNQGAMASLSDWLGSMDPETLQRILGTVGMGGVGGLAGLLMGGRRGALIGAGVGAGGYLGWRALLRPALERMALQYNNREASRQAIPDTSGMWGEAEHPELAEHFEAEGRRFNTAATTPQEGPGGRLGPNRSLQDIPGAPAAIGGDGSGFRGSNVFDGMSAGYSPYRPTTRFPARPASIF